ncbi:CopD family protein [Azoarcus sp. KH32C]|uniref:CopD family protein n=1 Tax=Azoarcus sp. KH32C TaxID=748247 RepID=UPI0002386615|nr:CopD family protein [Azoarcus sp. KH32C]BAL24699.1 integral membrane protein [Azoarcus sp. KH32C]
MTIHHLLLFLHLAGVVTWVGGMLFAYACLRPAASTLAPPQRLVLWVGVLSRFFRLVWGSVALIGISGGTMLVRVGFGHAPTAWHVMLLTGTVMIAVFMYIWFRPWPQLRSAVAREDWAAAAVAMNGIRQRVGFNLAIGIVTIGIATLGLGV